MLRGGLSLEVGVDRVERWLALLQPVQAALAHALKAFPANHSSSENVLLALPHLDPQPRTVDEVEAIVQLYVSGVAMLKAAGDTRLLSALAKYGRRWDMLATLDVTLDESITIRACEDRRMSLEDDGSLEEPFHLV